MRRPSVVILLAALALASLIDAALFVGAERYLFGTRTRIEATPLDVMAALAGSVRDVEDAERRACDALLGASPGTACEAR